MLTEVTGFDFVLLTNSDDGRSLVRTSLVGVTGKFSSRVVESFQGGRIRSVFWLLEVGDVLTGWVYLLCQDGG